MSPWRGAGWVLGWGVVASAVAYGQSPPPLPLQDPKAALSFDYCQWRYAGGGTADELPDFQSILENENGQASRLEVRAASLANAGTQIALASTDAASCRRTFASAMRKHTKAYAKQLKIMLRKAKMKFSKDAEIAAVQKKISDLWARDQAARDV